MLDWFKEILGNAWTEEIQKKVLQEIEQEFVSKEDFNAVSETKQELEEEIRRKDKSILDLKKASESTEHLQKQYEGLQEKYRLETQELQSKLASTQKMDAIELAILQAKGKNTKAIKALLNIDTIQLKENGTLDGLDLEALKKTDGYLFETNKTEYRYQPVSGEDYSMGNPWRKESFNLTEQGKIFKENPAQAKEMMRTAVI